MSLENPLWGAPRINGELLKLGFQVALSTVAKYIGQAVRQTTGTELADIQLINRDRSARRIGLFRTARRPECNGVKPVSKRSDF
jgi:hypothetical protein